MNATDTINMLYMEKLGMASYDAIRKKQYWQLLKRLYGGGENAVKTLTETHDPGIYHGTREAIADKILKHGLKPGRFREFGKGTFFGDIDIANIYGKPKIFQIGEDATTPIDRHVHDVKFNKMTGSMNQEELADFLERNPKYYADHGALLRIKMPSELTGTKQLYPDLNKAMVFDIKEGQGFHNVSSHLTNIENSPEFARANSGQKNVLKNEFLKLSDEELLKKDKENGAYVLFDTVDELHKAKPPGTEPYNNFRSWTAGSLAQSKIRQDLEDHYTPKTPEALHKMRHFGQINGERMFDVIHPDATLPRNEFFIQDNISPKLLKETAEAMSLMEKVALNAQKARAMAHDAGLFPEGQWQWALRKLRDSRGNLLEGKALADKKLDMGAVDNNSYQYLKRVNRKYVPGTYHAGEEEAAENAWAAQPKDSYQGTEIGGVINTNKHFIGDLGMGSRGGGSIPKGMRAYDLLIKYRHGFHTHPQTGRVVSNSIARANILDAKEGIEEQYDNPEMQKRLRALIKYDTERMKRNVKGRNPLLASPSGNLYQPGEGLYDRDEIYSTGGDLKGFYERAKDSNNRTLETIFAPDIDVEGIHKVKNNGGVRSIYFDRSPRKAR